MLIGAHVSIAGGLDKSLDRIEKLGGNCLMSFASSPRSLEFKNFSQEEIDRYNKKKEQLGIGPHFFHGIYLINLATDKMGFLDVCTKSLIHYQQLAQKIGGVGTIFHVGSFLDRNLEQTLDQIVVTINYILDSSPKGTKLIIENAAGHANVIGSSFQEIDEIMKRLGDRSKIGVCLDTQHAFASGYPLNSVLDQFDRIIGLKHLAAVHLNDSKVEFNSRRDRHANWGEGQIGLDSLEKFVNDSRLKNIPLLMEVPGDDKEGPRKQDLDLVKNLFKKPEEIKIS